MSAFTPTIVPPQERVHADEIGLEFGVIGNVVIKTTLQLVYAHRSGNLEPAMWRAGAEIARMPNQRQDLALPSATIATAITDRLVTFLALRNYRFADGQGLDIYVGAGAGHYSRPASFVTDVRVLASQLDELEIEPRQIVCELDWKAADIGSIQAMARALRRRGARLAISHSDANDPLHTLLSKLRPDMVRLAGDWLARVDRHHASRSLLSPLVHAVRSEGCQVLFEGIDSRHLMTTAIAAGADFLQGDHLQAASLAGTLVDSSPIRIPKAADDAKVVLMRQSATTPQRR